MKKVGRKNQARWQDIGQFFYISGRSMSNLYIVLDPFATYLVYTAQVCGYKPVRPQGVLSGHNLRNVFISVPPRKRTLMTLNFPILCHCCYYIDSSSVGELLHLQIDVCSSTASVVAVCLMSLE